MPVGDVIKRVIVGIGADVSDLKSGFGEATKVLQGFGNAVRGFQERAGQVAFDKLVAAARAVPDALMDATTHLIDMGGHLTDLSAKTDIAVGKLQEMDYAGSLVGVSLDSLTSSMGIMQRNLGNAGKETAKAIKDLGLSMSSIKAMSPDQQFDAIAAGLRKIEDPTKQAALGAQLMGRGFKEVLPYIKSDTDAAAAAMERLGFKISDDVVAAGDALGDSMNTLHKTFEGFLNNLVSSIITSQAVHDAVNGLTDIFGMLSGMVKDNQGAFQGLIEVGLKVFFGIVAAGMGLVAGFLQILQTLIEVNTAVRQSFMGAAEGAARFMALAAQKSGFSGTADVLTQQADALKKASAEQTQFEQKVSNGVGKAKDMAASAAVAFYDLAGKIGTGTVKLEAQEKQTKKNTAAVKELTQAQKDFATAVANQALDLSGANAEKNIAITETAIRSLGSISKVTDGQLVGLSNTLLQNAANAGNAASQAMAAGRAFDAWGQHIDNVGGITKLGAEEFKAYGEALNTIGKYMDDSAAKTDYAAEASDRMMTAIRGILKESEDLDAQAQSKAIESHLDEIAHKQTDWTGALKATAESMLLLGINADSAFYKIVTGVAGAFEGSQKIGEAFKDMQFAMKEGGESFGEAWKHIDFSKLLQGITQVIGAFKQATDTASGFGRALGGMMVGAKVGGQIGSLFGKTGEAWGKLIGGLVGGIVGIFRKPGWAKAADEAGKVFGEHVSKEMAKKIEADSKKLKISFGDAALLHIGDQADETGKQLHDYGSAILELMNKTASGAIPAAQGVKAIGEAWSGVREEAEAAGTVGDRLTVSMLNTARATGTMTKEMKSFVNDALDGAIKGVDSMVAKFSEDKGQGGRFMGGIDIFAGQQGGEADMTLVTQRAQAQGEIFASVFWASVKEKGLVGAADAMRDTFARLQENLSTALNPEQMSALLGPIKGVMDLTQEGGAFRGAAEGAQGLADAMKGIADAGYLTQDSMNAFGVAAQNAFDQAIAGGANQEQAIGAVMPYLQNAVSAAQQYGFALDGNTQKLVDQATAAGFAFPTDPMVKMVDLLASIATKLGADIPASVSQTNAALGGMGTAAAAGVGKVTQATTQLGTTLQTTVGQSQAFSEQLATQFSKVGPAVTTSLGGATSSVVSAVDTMVDVAGQKTDALQEYFARLGNTTITIPFKYAEQGDGIPDPKTGGVTGGGHYGGQHATGTEFSARTDGYLKYHRGEHVAVTPNTMAPGLAKDLASAIVGLRGGQTQRDPNQQPTVIHVQIGDEVIYSRMEQASKSGKLRIHGSAVKNF